MLTAFRRGRIIHGATYFDDAGQRSPVRDVATVVQYDTIAEWGINGPQRAAPAGVVNKGNRQILDKLYIDYFGCAPAPTRALRSPAIVSSAQHYGVTARGNLTVQYT